MDTTTCNVCNQQVPVTTTVSYPDGEQRQAANHAGKDGVVVCAGSLSNLS